MSYSKQSKLTRQPIMKVSSRKCLQMATQHSNQSRMIVGQVLNGILLLSIAFDQICLNDAAPMAPPAAAAAAATSSLSGTNSIGDTSYASGGLVFKNPMMFSNGGDNGQLLMEKRHLSFMPSRGKKQTYSVSEESNGYPATGDEFAMISNDHSNVVDKRTSGFLPMRGRKSYFAEGAANQENQQFGSDLTDLSSAVDELRQLPQLSAYTASKRVSAFMPMRGRKWDGNGAGQQEQLPSGYYYYYPGQQSSHAVKWNPVSDFQQSSEMEKRKGVAFFGSRGKRNVNGLG